MGIARRRCGVSDIGGGHDAGGHAPIFRPLQQCLRGIPGHGAKVPARDVCIHRNQAIIGLDAGHDRAHSRRGVRGLLIGAVGLGQGHIGQRLESKLIFFTGEAAQLAFENARGGHRGDAHAVANEQDHVSGAAGYRLLPQRFLHGIPAAAKPFFGRLRLRRRHLCRDVRHKQYCSESDVFSSNGHKSGPRKSA